MSWQIAKRFRAIRPYRRIAQALLVIAAALIALAGCGNSGGSELEDQISQNVPGAKDVHCTSADGDRYECTAIVNGERTVFRGREGGAP